MSDTIELFELRSQIRAMSLLGCSMILQAARDLTLPTDISPEMTKWQKIRRSQNQTCRQSALEWAMSDKAVPGCLGLKECVELINGYLEAEQISQLRMSTQLLRHVLLTAPETLQEIFVEYGFDNPFAFRQPGGTEYELAETA